MVQTGDPEQDEEDLCSAACAIYIVLLAAHARGLAYYWRTPGVLRTAAGCAAVGLAEDERVLGLIHLGPKRQEQPPPARPDLRVRNVSAVIRREDALKAFAEDDFDLVVIGGGITGAGVALDAATRGYSVALVEREDFASGTSSRSSKLVHGGLRYLQNFDLGLVREALLERSILVQARAAPGPAAAAARVELRGKAARPHARHGAEHVRPDGARAASAPASGAASRSWARRTGARRSTGSSRATRCASSCPRSPRASRRAAYLFYDCQTDDARLVLTVLGEAERFGAVIANRCRVDGLLTEDGARLRRALYGHGRRRASSRSAPTNVVNATGVWADQIRPEELHDEEEVPRIRPSRGTHITFAQDDCRSNGGRDRPRGRRAQHLRAAVARAHADRHDRQRLRGRRSTTCRPTRPTSSTCSTPSTSTSPPRSGRESITGAYAGVRPLISTGDPKKSVDISRKAELYETSSGLVTITGGKLTTWRRMAKMAVDRIVEREGREAPCRTHEIPLGLSATEEDLGDSAMISDETRALLAHRYGHAARDVLALAAEDERLAQPISPDLPDLMAEVVIAVRKEQALHGHRRPDAPHPPCPARRARACARPTRSSRAAWPSSWARSSAGTRRAWMREVADWHEEAAAEGFAPVARAGGGMSPRLMGIVNANPDSFSDPGARSLDELVAARLEQVEAGRGPDRRGRRVGRDAHRARSRPRRRGERVVPLVERLVAEGITVSVDTWKPAVAEAVLERGRRDDQRRQRPARPGDRGRVRASRRGAGRDAHARGAEGEVVPRLRRRGRRRARVPRGADRARRARAGWTPRRS